MGWQANGTGTINTSGTLGALKIPSGETIPAAATTSLTLGGNLPAWSGVGTPPVETSTISAYDALGNVVPVTLTFTGVASTANSWTVQGTVQSPSGTSTSLWATPPTIAFAPTTGQITSISGVTAASDGSYALSVGTMPAGYSFPTGDTWAIDFPPPNSAGAVTQFAGQQTLQIASQDGHASGTLESYSIGSDGVIQGSFSSGTTLDIGRIALASFTNPSGLADNGDGTYSATANSGQPATGSAGTGSRGTLLGGELEQSNVNLGTELTNLIGAQEAYQANTKVLTATQQVIQALESVA
jgi:flagellar hook protein FlgE